MSARFKILILLAVLALALTSRASANDSGKDVAADSHVLEPGDAILFQDGLHYPTKIWVMPDGTIVTPIAGTVYVTGMTLNQLRDCIAEKAKRSDTAPKIMLTLEKRLPQYDVYVLGEVVHPGLYDLPPNTKNHDVHEDTLADAIETAGGVKATADIRHIRITKLNPKQTFCIDMWNELITNTESASPVLQVGDVVYVPKGGSEPISPSVKENDKAVVRVVGCVYGPHSLTITSSDDIQSLIARCGGFTPEATRESVLVARANPDGTISTQKVDVRQQSTKILAGDLIIVKRLEDLLDRFHNRFLNLPNNVGDFETPGRLLQLK